MSDTKHETRIQEKFEILKFAKIYVHKIAKTLKFAKINARQIIERAIRENKCSPKLMIAKIYARKNVLKVPNFPHMAWVDPSALPTIVLMPSLRA